MFETVFSFLLPWEFSPTVLVLCAGSALIYLRGLVRGRGRTDAPGFWRNTAFAIGLVSMYAFLQTHLDYLSQHMFWIHRLQHLVLHHLGPFLIVMSAPQVTMRLGAPEWLRRYVLAPVWRNPVTQAGYRLLQNPVIAPVLFTGLIIFWLTPSIHFTAMLSLPRYNVMNWSMAIDGLLFWWLIVGPEHQAGLRFLGYGRRMLLLWAIMLPQIGIGAYIALTSKLLYSVYGVCGRAWPIEPMTDQGIGGLITWIPASMMSVVAALVVLARWRRSERADEPAGTPGAVLVEAPSR
ncbi:MAG: cytochrome c oxidase assembly protein [Betaproteobacteria bacterium]|nr:cytochrome c oxidase assembly protein [Betaproteobacteria bacterium]